MKKIIISVFVLISYFSTLHSQIEFGIKGGMHSFDLASESILIPVNGEEFNLNFQEAEYGFQFGLYTRIKLLGLFIEPSFMFHSTTVTYGLEEIGEEGVINTIRGETFNNFDIPVMFGFKLGPLKLLAGPVAHLHINGASDLIDIPGYEQRFEGAKFGYQAGVGIDLWKIRLEAKYEGNLSKFGEHINIGGEAFSFDNRPSRIIVNAGFAF